MEKLVEYLEIARLLTSQVSEMPKGRDAQLGDSKQRPRDHGPYTFVVAGASSSRSAVRPVGQRAHPGCNRRRRRGAPGILGLQFTSVESGAGRLAISKQGAYVLEVPEGSAAQEAAALLPDSSVVGAFHHLSAVLLEDISQPIIEGDVLVIGDDREATDVVQTLVARVPGLRGIYAGRLRNARQVEALTTNLVSINRRYKVHAGIRITDV